MTVTTFPELGLAEPLQRALNDRNHTTPTPIQAQAIPALLDGNDLLGIAQTGTGKTAAFALPILHHLSENRRTKANGKKVRGPRALILAPTRELAIQIGDEIRAYSQHLHIRHAVIYGGVSQRPQVSALHRGLDILVATPGRLLDLMNQGHCRLNNVEVLVLDEADRMLDMGFVHDVRKIFAAVPDNRQSLLFSATMPKEISKLAGEMMDDPVRVEVAPQATPIERIAQQVHHVPQKAKTDLLADLMADPDLSRVIVFTRTKHKANRVARYLDDCGVPADAIHGNKSQGARQRALGQFRSGKIRVLVATDIAARGIDIDDVSHVVNFELPNEPESYVHRIGRTARAGSSGIAISFCDSSERAYLRDIERLIKMSLDVVGDGPSANDREGRDGERNGQRPHRKRHRNRKRGGGHGGHGGPKRPEAANDSKPSQEKPKDGAGRGRPHKHRRRRSRRGPSVKQAA